jgi:hypothetical protein
MVIAGALICGGLVLVLAGRDRTPETWSMREIGRSVEGRPIRAYTIGEGPTVLLLAGVHGDEGQGSYCARRVLALGSELGKQLLGHSVTVVPALNPDGLVRRTRGNAHGVDLNRNMPSRNWSATGEAPYLPGSRAGSEPETQALLKLLEETPPVRIVTIHAPLRVVNYDGPLDGAAERMAELSGLPLAAEIGYATPGSLGTWAGVERDIPTITLELPDKGPRACWRACEEALLVGLTLAPGAS